MEQQHSHHLGQEELALQALLLFAAILFPPIITNKTFVSIMPFKIPENGQRQSFYGQAISFGVSRKSNMKCILSAAFSSLICANNQINIL